MHPGGITRPLAYDIDYPSGDHAYDSLEYYVRMYHAPCIGDTDDAVPLKPSPLPIL